MPRSRQPVVRVAAPRVSAPPAVTDRPPPRGEISLTSILGGLTPDPAAEAKDRLGRVSRLLWWTHRRLEYEHAAAVHGDDNPGLPPRVTPDDVARACGLSPAQQLIVAGVRYYHREPEVLRRVGDAVDAG